MTGTADDITRDLVAWAGTVLPNTKITSMPLGAREREKGVDIRMIGLAPRPAPRTPNPTSVINLDYLITAQMDDPLVEQNALAELLLAAAGRSDFEIVAGRPAAETCVALGIPAAAGFVLRTSLTRTREPEAKPLVRFPLKVGTAELGAVEGTVVGPGATPIAGAVVAVPGLRLEARTDAHGRFRIAPVPRDQTQVKLTVKARGVAIDAAAIPGENVVLRLPFEV